MFDAISQSVNGRVANTCNDSEAFVGISYAALDVYIRTGVRNDPEVQAKIRRRHKANLFELQPTPTF